MTTQCPRCGKILTQAGEASVEGRTYPVFQCDDCTTSVDFGGKAFPAAYTFALDERGRPIALPDDLPPQAGQ